MRRCAIVLGVSAAVGLAACDTTVAPLGVELAGGIRISASLHARVPIEEGGTVVEEIEPNTALPGANDDGELHDLGLLLTGGGGLRIRGSLGAADARDRFLFRVSDAGFASVWFRHTCSTGATRLYCAAGRRWTPAARVAATTPRLDRNDGVDRTIVSYAVRAGREYLIEARYANTDECGYTIDLGMFPQPIVTAVYVGVFSTATPAVIDDPITNHTPGHPSSRLPLAGTRVTGLRLATDGSVEGDFRSLFVPENSRVYLYAYADNDGNNTTPLDFVIRPPTTADFVMSTALALDVGTAEQAAIALAIDAGVDDADFDGVSELRDNCRTKFNLDQSDVDLDGIGDVCDNCPDISNSTQENTDLVGKGDACNESPETTCPYVFLRPMTECSSDPDGDEYETDYYACPEGERVCDLSELEVRAMDVCPEAADDQRDTDGDAIDALTYKRTLGEHAGGNACDGDDDNDGIADADDEDDDNDGVADTMDNCPAVNNPEQVDADGNGIGDLCDG